MAIGFNEDEYNEAQSEFLVLPAGKYKVRVTEKTKDNISKNSGKDQIILELEVIEGPKKGRTVRNYLTDGEKSSSFIGQALVGFGIPLSSVKVVNAATFIGKVAMIETTINGEYANVKRFLPKDAVVTASEGETFSDKSGAEDDIPF